MMWTRSWYNFAAALSDKPLFIATTGKAAVADEQKKPANKVTKKEPVQAPGEMDPSFIPPDDGEAGKPLH